MINAYKTFTLIFTITLGSIVIFYNYSSKADNKENEDIMKCIPFTDTVLKREEMPETPGEIVTLAEKYCKKGSKMHIVSIPEWWVQYVIYNVCDMQYSLHVERFGNIDEPLASVVCLYEGKNIYD